MGERGVSAGNMASIGIELATALGNLGWLAYKNRQVKKSQSLL